jgi:enamine deaminase RidA (YjgF/YER057c/UK114 family)
VRAERAERDRHGHQQRAGDEGKAWRHFRLNLSGGIHVLPYALNATHDNTMTIERRNVGKRLSDLVIYAPPPDGRLVYLAGQVAEERKADITLQTRSVLAQIDRLLGEAGTDKTKILSATIYLADMSDYQAMNAVWDQWVPAGETPARATVEAKLAHPDYRVEMQVVAAAG